MKILTNKIQCLECKDVIESLHRHDYVQCSCGNCAVDGGKDYLRRSQKKLASFKELSTWR